LEKADLVVGVADSAAAVEVGAIGLEEAGDSVVEGLEEAGFAAGGKS
jgi:hypothetical protein